jgi:NitT/TauT family transport system substrate-binding protein
VSGLSGLKPILKAGGRVNPFNRLIKKEKSMPIKLSFRILNLFIILVTSACSGITPAATTATAIPPAATSAPIVPTAPVASPLPPTPIKACYTASSAVQMPLWYVYEKGLFKKYNLDVELVNFDSGNLATSALIAGKIQFCQFSASNAINAVIAGEDLAIVGQFYDVFLHQLFVLPEIKSAADLKGKTLGVQSLGGMQDTAIRVALKSLGLDPDNDVAIIAAGQGPDRVRAMSIGKIAGSVFSSPDNTFAARAGYHMLLDLNTLGKPYMRQGIITKRSYILENREAVLNFMKAISEGVRMMKSDPEGWKAIMAKYLTLDTSKDADILDTAYQEYVLAQLPDQPDIKTDGIQTAIDEAAIKNPDAAKVKPEDMIDLTILQELEAGGFFKGIEQ